MLIYITIILKTLLVRKPLGISESIIHILIQKDFKIYIVEDDAWYGNFLQHHLSKNPDFNIRLIETGHELLNSMDDKPDLICLDYTLPDYDAIELIKQIQSQSEMVNIIVISGQKDVKKAIDILKYDCVQDYIVKDDDVEQRIWKSIHSLQEKAILKKEVKSLRNQLEQNFRFDQRMIGTSKAIQKVFRLMERAAASNINVSITGETGTGKDLAAQCIHYNSKRAKESFVAVNITAIPNELLESELFGHEKGAFTGAHAKRIGKFEEAHNGTIFLDEIGDMDPSVQTRLLRVLQEREIMRLGSNKTVKIDVRLIVATHKNLYDEVKNGRFREDLYFRLLGLNVEIPPLRNRKEDIVSLSEHFIERFCAENKQAFKPLTTAAKKKLMNYPFAGNIRELKAVIDLAIVMTDSDEISEESITFNNHGGVSELFSDTLSLKEYTAKIIRYYLDQNNDDVSLVAKQLDIGKSTLYRMMQNGEV